MPYPKSYSKELTHLTTCRLSQNMRHEAKQCADYLGISFSDFLRQSLTRNIHVSMGIEAEVNRQATARAMGKTR
jgi:antitoxin component of RelBE/YafQ-DinJ toxin-antitoxin module